MKNYALSHAGSVLSLKPKKDKITVFKYHHLSSRKIVFNLFYRDHFFLQLQRGHLWAGMQQRLRHAGLRLQEGIGYSSH